MTTGYRIRGKDVSGMKYNPCTKQDNAIKMMCISIYKKEF